MFLPTHGCGSPSMRHPTLTPHSLMNASGRYGCEAAPTGATAIWDVAATATIEMTARFSMVVVSDRWTRELERVSATTLPPRQGSLSSQGPYVVVSDSGSQTLRLTPGRATRAWPARGRRPRP